MSVRLAAQAWSELLFMEFVGLLGFHAVKRSVTQTKSPVPSSATPASPALVEAIVGAMTAACAFYFKRPECLQRSAVVTRMLRKRGVEADMVIGCHLPPLKAHAWVEIAGDVVSDDLDGLEHYRVLDRW